MDHEGGDPDFSVTTSVTGERATVTVTGEVDMSTAVRMHDAAILDATTGDAAALLLDLRAVTFFDSAAIHTLIRIAEHYGAALRVLPSAQVRRVLEISGLAGQPWLAGVSD